MKESYNTEMNGKFQQPPPAGGPGDNISSHYQQLPINVILSRLQVQPLIEEHSQRHELHVPVYIFQNKRLALLRH